MRVLHLLDPAVLKRTEYRDRTLALVGALRDQGVQTMQMAGPAVSLGADDDTGDGADEPSWHVYRTPAPAASRWLRHACPPALQATMSGAALLLRLRQLARLTRPDLIHVHTPSGPPAGWHALAALAAAGHRPLPLVFEAERRGAGSGTAPALQRWALAQAAALSAPSLEMRAALRASGIACRRIAVIPPASDLAGTPFGARQPAGLEGAPLLAFAGRLDRAGGIDLLLAVLGALRKRHPALRLLVAGGGMREAALAQSIAAPALRGHVVVTGTLSSRRVADVLPRADIAVFPALPGAAQPLAASRHLVNAMAQGCAIVASDIACHRELLVHGHNALLFHAGSRRALANVLADLLQRPEKRQLLGAAAAQLVSTRHSWSGTATAYRALYQAVLTESRPALHERKFQNCY